jgi:hypothetical protein
MKLLNGSNRLVAIARLRVVFAAFVATALVTPACDVGKEGERCNPLLTNDECGSGLSCQEPTDCPESYCCPTMGTSTNPYCQHGCAGGLAAICAASPAASPDCPTDAGQGGDASPDPTVDAPSEAAPSGG